MDKIDRSQFNFYMMGDSPVVKSMDKLDELVEGYNEIRKRIEEIVDDCNDLREAYHVEMSGLGSLVSELNGRLERMDKRIAILYSPYEYETRGHINYE